MLATDVGNGDSDSDKITEVSTARTSKSRTSVCSSRGTKGRKLKKLEAYIKNKCAQEGREMSPWENQGQEYLLSPEDRDAKAKAALTPATPLGGPHCIMALEKPGEGVEVSLAVLDKKTSATDVYAQIIAAANKDYVHLWDRLFTHQDEDFTTRFAQGDLQAIHNRVVDLQADRCLACNKSGLYGHAHSKQHQQSLAWHASCDALLGKTPGARVFASGLPLGPNGELEEAELKRFWGCDVFNLGAIGTKILLEKGLFVKPRRSAPGFVVPGTNIAGASMAFVEFTCGQSGKYSHGGARLRWPHQLSDKLTPPKDPAMTWWPILAVSFKIDQEKELATFMNMQVSEKLDENDIVWEYEEKVAVPVTDPAQFSVCTSRCIWICCQEQLQWPIPHAWPFPLGNRT
jgi:hypothetical protein